MGMSTFIYVIKPPDEDWKKMKAIWDACKEAGVDPPEPVGKYFDWEQPDDEGVHRGYSHYDFERGEAPAYLRRFRKDHQDGFEVVVADIPEDIKIIRLVNSW